MSQDEMDTHRDAERLLRDAITSVDTWDYAGLLKFDNWLIIVDQTVK